jgi:hypothetical protein
VTTDVEADAANHAGNFYILIRVQEIEGWKYKWRFCVFIEAHALHHFVFILVTVNPDHRHCFA